MLTSRLSVTRVPLAKAKELRDFFARVYRPDHPLASTKFFNWYLTSSPFSRDNRICSMVALRGEDIVGHCGFLPVKISVDQKVKDGLWAANLFVHPNHRRQGIGQLLIDAVTREAPIALDIGASPTAEGILEKCGWSHMGTLERIIAVIDGKATESLSPGCQFSPVLPLKKTLNIVKGRKFTAEADILWREFGKIIRCGTLRNSSFLNWRYVNHPFFKYDIFFSSSRLLLRGYAVTRIEKVKDRTERVMRIVEFVSLPDSFEDLYFGLIEHAHKERVAFTDFFCSSKKYILNFERFGSIVLNNSVNVPRLFNPLVPGKYGISFNLYGSPDLTASMDEWYVTAGDSDQDRPNNL